MANSNPTYQRTPAEQEFVDFLDSIATPLDSSKPIIEPGRDYPREKQAKREGYRHRYLMANNFWYRQDYIYGKQQEQLRLEAELEGKEYVEPEPIKQDEQGFWEQF